MKLHPHIRMFLTTELRKLEYDPQAQYKFNLYCAWFWLLQMPIVLVMLIWLNKWWIAISVFYIAEASVWALVATHFGAMSAALAAHKESEKDK